LIFRGKKLEDILPFAFYLIELVDVLHTGEGVSTSEIWT